MVIFSSRTVIMNVSALKLLSSLMEPPRNNVGIIMFPAPWLIGAVSRVLVSPPKAVATPVGGSTAFGAALPSGPSSSKSASTAGSK